MDLFGRFTEKYIKNPPKEAKADDKVDDKDDDKKSVNSEVGSEIYTYDKKDMFFLSEQSPRQPTPTNFQFNLTVPQQASLYAMHQMETFKVYTCKQRKFYTSAGILSNALGSGKTATMLALLTEYPVPTNGPKYLVHAEMVKAPTSRHIATSCPRGVILKKFNIIYRPALVFVGYGVLDQWEREIKKFNPNLKYFKIDGIHALRKFYRLLYTPEINSYHVILVKNKTISGEWTFEHGELDDTVSDRTNKSIYNTIGVICRDMCFTRLVIDDFDTIGVPAVAANINAMFTWFISCTRADITRKHWHNTEHQTVEGLIHNNNITYNDIIKNDILYQLFNIVAWPEFQQKYTKIGKPAYWYYLFKNPNGKIADLINIMAGDKVSAIMEALNGDAPDEAARIAGIESTNANDILKSLLSQNFANYKEARGVLDLFDSYFNKLNVERLPSYDENPDQTDTYTRKDLRAGRRVEYRYPGIRSLFKEEEAKWKQVFQESGACLDKFKVSVSSNECQVCCLELNDPNENYCILPCCHEIIHADCANRGCQFRSETNANGKVIVGKCPFNKSHIVHFNQLCYIKGGFDLSQVDEKAALVDSKDQKDEIGKTSDPTKPPRTKYDAILDIINGEAPDERKSINLHIPALMEGVVPLPQPLHERLGGAYDKFAAEGYSRKTAKYILEYITPNASPRVLIFANFNETLDKLVSVMKENKIRYNRLGGHQSQLNEQIRNYQDGVINVLLINSTEHCSGLNFQMATDLIFAHHIKEHNLQSQVVGRIQREGRLSNAAIHFMLYDNELPELNRFKRD